MKKATISPKARADLKDISLYTDEKWGRQQRFNYIKQLKDRFPYLADKPQMGKRRSEIIGSPYSYHEGRHVIFYRTTAEGIEILRVLHDSMDFPIDLSRSVMQNRNDDKRSIREAVNGTLKRTRSHL